MTNALNERVMRRLKLRELRILMTAAQAGSMGKAATQLALSQPAVSKAIAGMEHTLGVRLLDRTAQGIEPTLYGRVLLKWAAAVFDDLRQGRFYTALTGYPSDEFRGRDAIGSGRRGRPPGRVQRSAIDR